MQLELDFERRERETEAEKRRRDKNRAALVEHLGRAGIRAPQHRPTTDRPPTDHRPTTDRPPTNLRIEIVVAIANAGRIVEQDGLRRIPVRWSERELAGRLGCSKSGAREALLWLEGVGLVTRGHGLIVLEWDAVCGLEPGGAELPAPRARLLEQETNYHHPPTHPRTKNQEPRKANGVPESERPKQARLDLHVRWSELFARRGDRHLVRPEGVERLHVACVDAGWVEPGPAGLAHVAALVSWLPSQDRRASGVEHPIGWLIAALRGGRDAVVSWPREEVFGHAEDAVATWERKVVR